MINVDHHFHENYSTIFGRFLQFLPIFRDPDGHCWDARKRSVRNLLQRTEGRKPMRRLSGAPKDIVRLANSLVNGLIFGANFRIRYVKFHAKEWVLFLDPVFRDIIPGTIDVHGRPAREG